MSASKVELTVETALEELKNVPWPMLRLTLGIDRTIEAKIGTECRGDEEAAMAWLLRHWLDNYESSWEALAKALMSVPPFMRRGAYLYNKHVNPECFKAKKIVEELDFVQNWFELAHPFLVNSDRVKAAVANTPMEDRRLKVIEAWLDYYDLPSWHEVANIIEECFPENQDKAEVLRKVYLPVVETMKPPQPKIYKLEDLTPESAFTKTSDITDWYALGYFLGIQEEGLYEIEEENPRTDSKRQAVLDHWLKFNKEEANWANLGKAISKMRPHLGLSQRILGAAEQEKVDKIDDPFNKMDNTSKIMSMKEYIGGILAKVKRLIINPEDMKTIQSALEDLKIKLEQLKLSITQNKKEQDTEVKKKHLQRKRNADHDSGASSTTSHDQSCTKQQKIEDEISNDDEPIIIEDASPSRFARKRNIDESGLPSSDDDTTPHTKQHCDTKLNDDSIQQLRCNNCKSLKEQLKFETRIKRNMRIELDNYKKGTCIKKLEVSPIDAGMQFDCTVPIAHCHIYGAYIAGRKSFTIRGNESQSLDWSEFGFKLSFPRDTLQHDEYCEVAVLALAGGNYKFPKNTEVVSAIYSINFQTKIYQPATIYIQHCIDLATERQATELHFVATGKCHNQNEGEFDFIDGGQFEVGGNYGYIEKMHFCETTIVESKDGSSSADDKNISNVKYTGVLLYEATLLNQWLVKFFVFKQLIVHQKFIMEKCAGLKIDETITFTFTKDEYIRLALTAPKPNGWKVYPHSDPLKLDKSTDVDHFGSSLISPASCLITIIGKESPNGTELLHYPIELSGIKCSKEKLFIICSLGETPQGTSTDSSSSQNSISNSSGNADTDNIKRLVATIKDVFTENISDLNSLLEDSIEDFAREMLQKELISRAVSRKPNYTKVFHNFLAKFPFSTEQKEIEKMCLHFLEVLDNIGEQRASKAMKKKLVDKVKTKLNIDLHLDKRHT